MEATNNNKGIVNSMSLIAFAKKYGKMQLGKFTDKSTGEIFKSCIFTSPADGEKTFVAFSSKMGELSAKEIVEQKDALQVVELTSGSHILCRQGENGWEEIDLGI